MKKTLIVFAAGLAGFAACKKEASFNGAPAAAAVQVTEASSDMSVSRTSFAAGEPIEMSFDNSNHNDVNWLVTEDTINNPDDTVYHSQDDPAENGGNTDTVHYGGDSTYAGGGGDSTYNGGGDSTGNFYYSNGGYSLTVDPAQKNKSAVRIFKSGDYIVRVKSFAIVNGRRQFLKSGFVKLKAN